MRRAKRSIRENGTPNFIDMPVVNPKKQKTPSFTGDVVTGIVATREYTYRDPKRNVDVKCELRDVHRVLFILCAASGLRFGEALGIETPNVSVDGSCIRICKKAWQGQMHDFLKTKNGEREIDLHSSVAKILRDFIGERKSGLLFPSRTGRPLHQSDILRRVLHPILAKLGQPKCGVHAFRRFRNTYLRNYTSTPPGVYRFWMGHASADGDRLREREKACPTATTRQNTNVRCVTNGPKERGWVSNFRPKYA